MPCVSHVHHKYMSSCHDQNRKIKYIVRNGFCQLFVNFAAAHAVSSSAPRVAPQDMPLRTGRYKKERRE